MAGGTAPAGREQGELAAAYGKDRLVALARDPHCLYAYWEITPRTRIESLRELGEEAAGVREVLRVRELGGGPGDAPDAERGFEVELPPGADSWYLNVPRDGALYRLEIALRAPSGRCAVLARSNAVRTPRAGLAPEAPPRWTVVGGRENAAPQEATASGPVEAKLPPEATARLDAGPLPSSVSSAREPDAPFLRPRWWR